MGAVVYILDCAQLEVYEEIKSLLKEEKNATDIQSTYYVPLEVLAVWDTSVNKTMISVLIENTF